MNNDDPIITHHIGRFMIQVPQSMKVARRSASMRAREIEELTWSPSANHDLVRESLWKSRLQEIEHKTPPRSEQKTITEIRPLSSEVRWTQAVSYFGDSMTNLRIFWGVLLDAGPIAVVITAKGKTELKEKILQKSLDIARAYRPIYPATLLPKENAFYLEHGFIALPYASQEEAYARFEGHPLGLILRLQTNETHEVEEHGLIERTAAAITSGFAAGVDIERLRSRKRTLAGIVGEEEVDQMKSKDDSKLSFAWIYTGKKDSGDYPEIELTMESADGQLEEKLKVWDALLNSFEPVAQ